MELPSAILRGDRLLACRERQAMTLQEVAEAAGITAPYLSQLERGVRRRISAEKVAYLAIKLGVSVDYLLGLSERETVDPDLVGTMEMRVWQPLSIVPER